MRTSWGRGTSVSLTINVRVVSSMPTRGDEIFNVFICPGNETKRGVDCRCSLRNKSAECKKLVNREWSVLKLSS